LLGSVPIAITALFSVERYVAGLIPGAVQE
jgi:hypothetical protein